MKYNAPRSPHTLQAVRRHHQAFAAIFQLDLRHGPAAPPARLRAGRPSKHTYIQCLVISEFLVAPPATRTRQREPLGASVLYIHSATSAFNSPIV
uniref:Uncharacterized protein n=1 Tax=Mesocestoides corti TaxID=53468 RepID=A0A5K3ENA0_MESCO